MKRIMLLSIWVFMTVVLVSCSNSAGRAVNENTAPQSTADKAADSAISETGQNSGVDINVSLGETGENMSLPESFPDEVLPLPDDANIINVNDNKDTKAISITFKTGKNFEEAIAFYQDIMKNGTIHMEDKKDESYLLMGSKDKYNIVITVSKYNGENISVLLNVSSL